MADRLPAELLMKILALVDTRRTPFRPPTPHLLRASLVSHFWRACAKPHLLHHVVVRPERGIDALPGRREEVAAHTRLLTVVGARAGTTAEELRAVGKVLAEGVEVRLTAFGLGKPDPLLLALADRQHIRLWQCRFQAPQLPPVFPNLLSLSLSQSSIPFEMAARLFHPDALPSLRSLVLDFADIRDAPTPHIIFHPALLVRLDLFQLNSHLYSKESASLVPPLLGPPFPVLVTFHPYALEHLTRDPNLHGIEHLN